MQPSHSIEKSSEPIGWEDGAGRDEKPTLVDAERDASRSKDADGVGSNKIGYASIDEEASVINKGGGATTGMVLDSVGESILNSEKSRLKANGDVRDPNVSPCLHPVAMWATSFPWLKREERHTGTNGATPGRTQPDRSR